MTLQEKDPGVDGLIYSTSATPGPRIVSSDEFINSIFFYSYLLCERLFDARPNLTKET